MLPMRELATVSGRVPPSVLAELREARAAAKRLGVDVVQRGPAGQWRAATLTPTDRRARRVDALLAEQTATRRSKRAEAELRRRR
jgi:hypothetical protein